MTTKPPMTTPGLKEALDIVEGLIRRDPACFNLSDELQPIRAALRATLSQPTADRREIVARKFDDWFDRNFLDPDGGSSHLPDWLKDDLRLAWNEALAQSEEKGRDE